MFWKLRRHCDASITALKRSMVDSTWTNCTTCLEQELRQWTI